MSRTLPRSSRRSALGLGLAVAFAGSGCSPSSAPTQSRSPKGRAGTTDQSVDAGSTTAAVPDADPDTALVAQVLDEVSQIHARVRANRRAHRPLTQRLSGLERLHARHAAELGGLVSVSATSAPAEKREARVLARLDAAEVRLQRRLVRASIAAESGALALLLAAMAAGIAQERTRL